MKRGLVVVTMLAVILTGCARPGTNTPSSSGADGSNQNTAESSAAPTPGSRPLASCVDSTAAAGLPTTTSVPTPEATHPDLPTGPPTGPLNEQQRGEQFRRNKEANNAFRERRPLSPAVQAANKPCADAVRAGLDRLRAQNRYDAGSVEQVLTSAGLTGVNARPPGRLDLGSGSGLVFAGSTGQGCVFGHHGPDATTVEFGSGIADGGCLPAPD